MFTQSIQVFLLLFCLYTTSEQINQNSNSEYKLPNQYASLKTVLANQAEHWPVWKRNNIFNVNPKYNLHIQQVQHKAYRPSSWLAEHANSVHKHQKHFKTEEATQTETNKIVASPEIFESQTAALKIVATQSAAPEIVASRAVLPNIVESQATPPEIEARQYATPESEAVDPEIVPRENVVPKIMASKAMAPEIMASEAANPGIVASEAGIIEIAASEVMTPEIMASRPTTPEIVSSQSVTPVIVENRALTLEIVTRQTVTLEIVASKAEAPKIVASEAAVPGIEASQAGTTEIVASQAATPKLKATQAVISELDWTQNVPTPFATQYNSLKRTALTEVSMTPGKNAPKDYPCKHQAIKDKSSTFNAKCNCTINFTDKSSNTSELSNTYNDKVELKAMPYTSFEFKPQHDITSEQNMTQQAITKTSATADIHSKGNTTHENVQFKLNQEYSFRREVKQKLTNNHKEIQIEESSSKHTIENALHSNTTTENAKTKRAPGYTVTQQVDNKTERTLASRETGIPALNHDQYILPESSMNENTSDLKYSNCSLLIKDKTVTLMCRNLSLTYIPKTVQKIDNIIFEYNNITNVTKETFSNISEPEYLKGLALNYDNIHNISSNALDKFVNLVYLHVSGNPFDYNNLKYLLGALSKLDSLRYLRMEDVHTITIQYDLFSLMAGTKIDFLILKRYNLGLFSLDVLKHFSYLRKLALSQNNITDIELYEFSHLDKLYIDQNLFRTVPNFCYRSGNRSVSYFPRLYQLSLKSNRIIEVKKESFKCLRTVERLELGINYLSVLPNNFLGFMPKLYALEINNENGHFIKIEPFAFRSNSLGDLRMGYNADALSIFSSLSDTFKSAPNIKVLKIDYISMLHLTNEHFKQLFGPLKHLLFLRCFACKITLDPKVILANKPDLNNLDLGSNLIQTLSDETFSHNKKLKIIKLRYNKIGHLQESALPMSLLNNLEKFDLSANPFTCDCNLQWLIEWLKTSMKTGKNVTQHYPDQYLCSNPADKANMKLSAVNFSYRACHPWSPGIWFAVVGCPCIVVIGIISLIVYRNRWNIKHYIFLLRKRRNYQLIHGQNFEYDAFVGYEADDSAWVRRNLLPTLEDGEGLKLCLHERDFLAGIFINDNIVKSMDKSKKIILILTNSFARSDWCMFELKVAHSMLIENKTDVVVILLEKIDARNMNHSLKLLFETTTYMEWTEDPVGRELFWNKLKDAVKK